MNKRNADRYSGISGTDLSLILITVITVASAFLAAATIPAQLHSLVMKAFHFVCFRLDFFFLIGAIGSAIFLFWFAFSKYGSIRLGGENAKPDFPFTTYAFMMFTAGVGSSLIYWAVGEPILYMDQPPMYTAPGSLEASQWALAYPLFHWGPIGWAIYALPSVPFAYSLYVKKSTHYRVSDLCSRVIGSGKFTGATGNVLNICSVMGILCAVATSTGFCVDLVETSIRYAYGVDTGLVVEVGIIVSITLIFTLTCISGIKKGISKFSNLCTFVSLAFGLFVLVSTCPEFIVDYYLDSLGMMLQNLPRMATWLDPVGRGGFPQNWTVYYWAWYFSFFVMMGLFLARISHGRTFRQLIFTCISCGSLGCSFFLGIFGGYAVHAEVNNGQAVSKIASQQGISVAILNLIMDLPVGKLAVLVFLLVQYFLLITTINSSVYALSSMSCRNVSLNSEPPTKLKLLWAFIVSSLCIAVFFIGGGITTIKSICVITGFPMAVVAGLSILNMMLDIRDGKGLHSDG